MGCRTGVLFITALYQSQSPPLLSFKSFFKWAIPDLFFFIFVFPTKLTANKCSFKNSPIPWFKPRTSGVGINCSANWAPGGGAPSFESLFEISFSDQSQRKFWKRQFRLLSKFLAGKIEMARRERDIWKDLCTVWPDWVIYWNLGNFSKLVATMILPKSPTLLGNFCRGVKISSFFQWNHFWATFIDIWQLFTGHTAYGWTE